MNNLLKEDQPKCIGVFTNISIWIIYRFTKTHKIDYQVHIQCYWNLAAFLLNQRWMRDLNCCKNNNLQIYTSYIIIQYTRVIKDITSLTATITAEYLSLESKLLVINSLMYLCFDAQSEQSGIYIHMYLNYWL